MSDTKSHYEIYRERVAESALKLPKAPTEIAQHILWLKSAAIERIEEVDKLGGKDIYTFRAHNRKEISLTEAMNLDKSVETYKFGFSEHYVNLLMHYAYEAGLKANENAHKEHLARMSKALEGIADIVEDFRD